MSTIISTLKSIFIGDDEVSEDEFIYFWDDIIEEEEYVHEKKSLSEKLDENIILILHLFIFLLSLPLLLMGLTSILTSSFWVMILGGIGFVLTQAAILFSYFILRNRYQKPIEILENNMARVAKKDLQGSNELLYNREQYTILSNFDNLRMDLSESLRDFKVNAEKIQLSINSVQNQLNRSYNQLDTLYLDIEGNIASVGSYQQSKGYLKQVSDGIDDLTLNFDEALNGIQEMSSTVRSIGKQTTMLALNAGIEAARAGEYGKGFEVVAANLRRLAQHAIKTSDDISILSEDINNQAKGSLETISDGMGHLQNYIDTSHEQISEATGSLGKITSNVNQLLAEQSTVLQTVEKPVKILQEYDL